MDFEKEVRRIHGERHRLEAELVPLARAAANVLEDLQQNATARPIKEILFQLDALQEHGANLIRENPGGIIEMLMKAPPPRS
jgi:hypothetical protein